MDKGEYIREACKEHGCTEERAKRHFHLHVHENWCVHPPKDFMTWYWTSDDGQQGANPITAYNSHRVRQEYLGAKEIGCA